MKYLAPLVLGFLFAFLGRTFFGSIAFSAFGFLYAYILYLFFFGQNPPRAFLLLIGISLAEELLGSAHFGTASLLAFIIIVLHSLLANIIRFTSLYVRYLVALFLLFLIYPAILYPFPGLTERLFSLLFMVIPIAVISYFLSGLQKPSTYEHI